MLRLRIKTGLSALLCLALLAPAWAAVVCAPPVRPTTLRDMAACCARSGQNPGQHCPGAPAHNNCCQQRIAAPAPAAWISIMAPAALVLTGVIHTISAPPPVVLDSAADVISAAFSPPPHSILRV